MKRHVPLKLVVLAFVMTLTTTSHAMLKHYKPTVKTPLFTPEFSSPSTFHQGLQPGLQGTLTATEILQAMYFAASAQNLEEYNQRILKYFQYPEILRDVVMVVRSSLSDTTITLEQILLGSDEVPLTAADLAQDGSGSYAISRWNEDFTTIQWMDRDPYTDESALRYKGVKYMSKYCGNLLFLKNPSQPKKPTEEPGEPYKPSVISYKETAQQGPLTVNNYVTVTGNGSNFGGNTGESDVVVGRRRRIADDGYGDVQRIEVKQKRDVLDYLNTTANLAVGVAQIKQAFWPAEQRMRISGVVGQYCNPGFTNCNSGFTLGGPWSAGTNLTSQGLLQSNLYTNGTGIIRPPLFSNDASVGRLSNAGFTSSNTLSAGFFSNNASTY